MLMKHIHIKNLFFFIFFLIIENKNISSMDLSNNNLINNNPLPFNKNYFFPSNTTNDNFLIMQSSQTNSTYAQYLAVQNVIESNNIYLQQLAQNNLSLTSLATTCDICFLILPTKGFLAEHKNFYHNLNLFQCYKCPQAFQTSMELNAHRIIHFQNKKLPSEKLLKCPYTNCTKFYKTYSGLYSHVQEIHTPEEKKKFQCKECKKKFATKRLFNWHGTSHDIYRKK